MTRIGIGSVMAAFGYLLVYAAVADKGKHALRPWEGLGD